MSDMRLAERHARLRAHEDEEMRLDAHKWVVVHFGGDYQRATWFLDECRVRVEFGDEAPVDTFFSVRTKTHRPIHLRTK